MKMEFIKNKIQSVNITSECFLSVFSREICGAHTGSNSLNPSFHFRFNLNCPCSNVNDRINRRNDYNVM